MIFSWNKIIPILYNLQADQDQKRAFLLKLGKVIYSLFVLYELCLLSEKKHFVWLSMHLARKDRHFKWQSEPRRTLCRTTAATVNISLWCLVSVYTLHSLFLPLQLSRFLFGLKPNLLLVCFTLFFNLLFCRHATNIHDVFSFVQVVSTTGER